MVLFFSFKENYRRPFDLSTLRLRNVAKHFSVWIYMYRYILSSRHVHINICSVHLSSDGGSANAARPLYLVRGGRTYARASARPSARARGAGAATLGAIPQRPGCGRATTSGPAQASRRFSFHKTTSAQSQTSVSRNTYRHPRV